MELVIGEDRLVLLKQKLVRLGFLNLCIVALLGLTLRSYTFTSPPFEYGKLLHGHSHFAFGGWLMPMMLWMILQYFPSLAERIRFFHWRNIAFTLIVSAWGMLLSFPVQGYGLISIFFSTLSVAAGFYLAIVLFPHLKKNGSISVLFLKWGLIYFCLSSVGAFATGPIMILGGQGGWLYYDSVYFYLHFQSNGWLVFVVMAVLYRLMEINNLKPGRKSFYLFNLTVVPAFFLSTLWHHPHGVFYWIGGLASLMQLAGLLILLKDYILLKEKESFVKWILGLVMVALVVKCFLQLLSANPLVADLAYQHRNLIIAYLHLVLLGLVSLFVMAMVVKAFRVDQLFKRSLVMFFGGFVITEIILVANGLEILVSDTGALLFGASILLVAGAFGMSGHLMND